MKELFPLFGQLESDGAGPSLPLYTDVAWDYARERPLFAGGEPVVVTGLEAVKSWAWRALKTARYRHSIFSWDYGCELEALVGQPYREDTKLQEAKRHVAETLLLSPYVTQAQVTEVSFAGDRLSMTVTLCTIYGKETLHV